MEKIIVSGGKRLDGVLKLQGSKNAALPIIFATIAIEGETVLYNLPDIGDVDIALKILSDFGATVERCGERVVINTEKLIYKTPNREYVSKLRASTYLIGACLARFGRAELLEFGGCNFGKRPIDIHLHIASSLGAVISEDGLSCQRLLSDRDITLPKPSVGATVNALIMSSSVQGKTILRGVAIEPHIISLIEFLRAAGAEITVMNTEIIVIGGRLRGASAEIIPDMIEAGTYMLLSLPLCGSISVGSDITPSLSSYLGTLCESGVVAVSEGGLLSLRGRPTKKIKVKTAPYPAFPTDLQPQMCPLMAAFYGGEIVETVWPERFNYLTSLSAFGIKYNHTSARAEIYKSAITPASTAATDLRGGAACLLTALMAKGQSEIYNPDVLLRGYSRLEENLTALGADIKIV